MEGGWELAETRSSAVRNPRESIEEFAFDKGKDFRGGTGDIEEMKKKGYLKEKSPAIF